MRSLQTISARLVKREAFTKAGRLIGSSYYLRLSRGDFYLKLCESEVNQERIEKLFTHPKTDELIGVQITVELSFREGDLDRCPGDPPNAQSRTGEYVVIHRLLTP